MGWTRPSRERVPNVKEMMSYVAKSQCQETRKIGTDPGKKKNA